MELREWQYINKPARSTTDNSSSGYKKRFEKLIKYHIDHASSELESVNNKIIGSWYFQLDEHYNTGTHEFDRIILVTWSDHLKAFILVVKVDGKEVYHNDYQSYEELLDVLTGTYMFLPDEGTSDYNDLLTESLSSELREWKYMNTPQPAASKNPYTNGKAYRYNRLLDQITSDGIAKYKLHKLSNIDLDITVDTAKTKNLNIKIGYDPADDDYVLVTNNKVTLSSCDYKKDILPLLIAGGVINNTNLCESTDSIADDFKLYENLWD
jgi:hypothetical protein